jgi:serine/threonine protein kinase
VIKIFPKEDYQKSGTNYILLRNEIEITRLCDHPNIVKYIDDFQDTDNYYLVIEYLPVGDLHHYVYSTTHYSSTMIKNITRGICDGIKYLHSIGVIHRDIKTENICLTQDFVPKIIDFGFSKFVGEKEENFDPCGTFFFVAPEVITGNPYGINVDIWSLGMTIYYMVEKTLPFYNLDDHMKDSALRVLKEEISFSEKFKKLELLKELVMNCINKDSTKRYSIEQVVNHPYFSS